jgi:YD repeat-containing protein
VARTLTAYDKSGRITRITTALNSSPSDLVSDTSYCYSPFVSGQSCPAICASTDTALLQYATNNMTGTVSVYSYDKADRLTVATNINGHSYGYAYDSDGNRTSVTTDGATTQSLPYNSAVQHQVILGVRDPRRRQRGQLRPQPGPVPPVRTKQRLHPAPPLMTSGFR